MFECLKDKDQVKSVSIIINILYRLTLTPQNVSYTYHFSNVCPCRPCPYSNRNVGKVRSLIFVVTTTRLPNDHNNLSPIFQTLLQLHTYILENPSLDVTPHLNSLSDVKRRLVEKILIDLRKSHSKARCHRTKLAISNEREQMRCNLVSGNCRLFFRNVAILGQV